jgi:aspartate/methionine/tyrosine aminotransferase
MKPQPFRLERYFAKHEFSAKYLLTCSDCEPLSQAQVLSYTDKETKKLWEELKLSYTHCEGLPLLREEIASLYKGICSDNILTMAPQEGIFLVSNALLDKSDHVICTFPGYQSLYETANAMGCSVDKWQPSSKDWNFDAAELAKKIRPDTKLIVINFPHNPTGFLPSKEDFLKIIDIARKNNIYVFSDEMYRFLELDPKNRLPSACEIYENAVTLGGMSKSFGLPGIRIGWVATKNKNILDKIIKLKDYTTICSSAPSEILALTALRAKDKILAKQMGIIRKNLAVLDKFFEKYSGLFSWVRPKAGSICFPKILFDKSATEFCREVLRDAQILLSPSTLFEYGDKHFRLGFGRKNMPQVIEKLAEYLKVHC